MTHVETGYDSFDMYTPEEGVNLIIEECTKGGTVCKGTGKNAKKYWKAIASFDIETTKVKNENRPEGYMAESYHYFNITFCWQFMIGDKFVFGREIEDFFSMLEKASKALPEAMLCVFVHNLAYELNNNIDYFTHGLYKEAFMRNGTTPLYWRWGSFEFRCTAQMTHKSLAMLGDEVGVEKLKDDFDYSKERDTETELEPVEMSYVYRDVLILNRWLEKETASYCAATFRKDRCSCFLPITQTGYVREDMKKSFSATPTGQYILNQTELSQNIYEAIRPSFYGGFTHSNFRIVGEMQTDQGAHVDITSAYPWSFVCKLFPYALKPCTDINIKSYLEKLKLDNCAQIAEIVFRNIRIKKGHIPYIPYSPGNDKVRGENVLEENGKVVDADHLIGTFCDVDVRLILMNYDIDEMAINTLYEGIKKPLPWPVVNKILQYFEAKTTLKGVEGAEYEYSLGKQKLNGIYGLSATDLMNSQTEINPETLEAIISEPEYKPAKVLPYQWAIYCTAYVREVVYGIVTYISGIDNTAFWYSDTDSVFYRKTAQIDAYIYAYNRKVKKQLLELSLRYFNIFPVNKKGEVQYLGTLSKEDDHMSGFITIGAKRYAIEHPDGTVDVTFSGLRATKVWKDKDGVKHNGYNTQRLIDKYGSIEKAFQKIKDNEVYLPYVDGVDKLSNYNVRYDFRGHLNGKEYRRPCTYTLYGQATRLSLNVSLFDFLGSPTFTEVW